MNRSWFFSVLIVLFTSCAVAPKTPFVDDHKRFQISFATKPKISSWKQKVGQKAWLEQQMFSSKPAFGLLGLEYSLSVAVLAGEDMRGWDDKAAFDGAKKSLVMRLGAQIDKELDETWLGQPARFLFMQVDGKWLDVRLVRLENTLYQLMVTRPDGRHYKEMAESFFNSFLFTSGK